MSGSSASESSCGCSFGFILAISLCGHLFAGECSLGAIPEATRSVAVVPLHTNSLGMMFAAVPGTEVRFCTCETRVEDFGAFVVATRYNATNDVFSPGDDGWKRRGWNWSNPGFPQGPTHPVAGVSWHDAKEFCRWLTATERRSGLLSDRQSYRLATDLEWSIAAGLRQEKGRTPELRNRQIDGVYPWGTSWPPASRAGNFAGLESGLIHTIEGFQDSFPRTAPVGSFAPNTFGLYDLGGNVWEWCEDWFDGDERYKVMRGGSWFSSGAEILLASHRDKDPPGLRNLNIGFRVVLVTNE